MKNAKSFFMTIFLAIVLVVGFERVVQRSPLSIFVLKGTDTNIEAFKLSIYLDRRNATVDSIQLDSSQENEAAGILKSKNVQGLENFSKTIGKFSFVMGLPTVEEGWPGYLGGGLGSVFQTDSLGTFDDLQATDRLYLALMTPIAPPPPVISTEVRAVSPAKTPTAPAQPTPAAVQTPPPVDRGGAVVRVEILNGCGITNAAEWVARRLKGPGIVIVDTDNADNFHYLKTLVRSATGTPVVLEDALERLGVPKESVVEISSPPVGIDVVVIIGKDFRKLKGKARGRFRH